MKTRESGMPEEGLWASFFAPDELLRTLRLPAAGDVVDLGCGYGTFTIPAARITNGTVHALDIDPEMAAITQRKAENAGLDNVRTSVRDFAADGTGLPDASVQYVMMFNILHAECPHVLLQEAYRVLAHGGRLGIVHWRYDPTTPRGPTMAIRPRPEQCCNWATEVGFRLLGSGAIELPPYHYGIVLERT
jgi:ubiquinone/menaquinone biosynthesis C-methylase UbiE